MISNHLLHPMYQLEITLNSTFITYQLLITIHPPSRQFLRNKMRLKKLNLGKCLLNKLLKLNRGYLGSWKCVFLKLVIFMIKQKSSTANRRLNDLMLKMVAESNVP